MDPGSPELLGEFSPRARGYLDSATYGLPPRSTVATLREALNGYADGTADWEQDWEPAGEVCRAIAGGMLGADAQEIALLPAVSVGVSLVAACLTPGDEVVVPDDEFTSLLFPLLVGAEHAGARVRRVPFAEVPNAVTPSTTVVATSHVQSNGGAVADLDAVAQQGAAAGALVVVDATHAMGILPIDTVRRGLDVVVAAAYKHLLCPRGVAFARVAPRVWDRLPPIAASWRGLRRPRNYYGGSPADLEPDARRYDVSLAWLPWVGAAASLEFLDRIDEHVRGHWPIRLANELAERLELPATGSSILGVPVVANAGVVLQALAGAGLTASVRDHSVRLSFHVYSTLEDVDRAAAVLQGLRPAGA